MKKNLSKLLIFIAVIISEQTNAQTASETVDPAELKILIGEWKGDLTYLDYSTGKPFSMPANVMVKQGKNDYEYILKNNYPNEPKANNNAKITLSKDGKKLDGKELKSKITLPDGNLQITMEYQGKDNRKKAMIRNLYTIGENKFVIRKEVKFEGEDEWILRNEFSYVR